MKKSNYTEETSLKEILAADDVELIEFNDAVNSLSNLDDLEKECGEFTYPERWILLMLFPSACDGELADREINYVKKEVGRITRADGETISKQEIESIIASVTESFSPQLLMESLKLFRKYLPLGALKNIAIAMTKAAGHDDLAEDEEEMIRIMLLYWYGVYSDEDIEEVFSEE